MESNGIEWNRMALINSRNSNNNNNNNNKSHRFNRVSKPVDSIYKGGRRGWGRIQSKAASSSSQIN